MSGCIIWTFLAPDGKRYGGALRLSLWQAIKLRISGGKTLELPLRRQEQSSFSRLAEDLKTVSFSPARFAENQVASAMLSQIDKTLTYSQRDHVIDRAFKGEATFGEIREEFDSTLTRILWNIGEKQREADRVSGLNIAGRKLHGLKKAKRRK